jgi:hypothetical protein
LDDGSLLGPDVEKGSEAWKGKSRGFQAACCCSGVVIGGALREKPNRKVDILMLLQIGWA